MLGHEMSAAWRRTYRRTGSRLAVKYTLQKRSTKSMRLRFASTAQNLQLAYSSPCPRRHQWPCHLSSHMGYATFIIFTESFAGRIGSSCTPMRSKRGQAHPLPCQHQESQKGNSTPVESMDNEQWPPIHDECSRKFTGNWFLNRN